MVPMVGPCLPALSSIRLFNVPPKSNQGPYAQAFFTLHRGRSNSAENGHISKNDRPEKSDLLYISESISVNCRMNFGVVSLPSLPQQTFVVRLRLWVSASDDSGPFSLAYELDIDLRNLRRLNPHTVDGSGCTAFTSNAVLWRFTDGHEWCLKAHVLENAQRRIFEENPREYPKRGKHPRKSYTLDDVRHMGSLVVGLRDFDLVKQETALEIESLHSSQEISSGENEVNSPSQTEEIERLRHSVANLEKMVERQESANEALEGEIMSRRNGAKRALHFAKNEFPTLAKLMQEEQDIVASQVWPLRESLAQSVYPHILSSTKALVTVMMDAFPVESAENAETSSTQYSISGIEFPSSIKGILRACYDESPLLRNAGSVLANPAAENAYASSVECVNAGLSEIVAGMNLLSEVMGVPLKYKMTFHGCRSYLSEHLSPQQVEANNRKTPVAMHVTSTVTYPLYYDVEQSETVSNSEHGFAAVAGQKHPRNVRFERGLALLNRNLTFFVSEITDLYLQYNCGEKKSGSLSGNIPLDCLDHFLWNLHYIMLFVTASQK